MAIKEDDLVRLKRNDATMVKWMCVVSPENRTSAAEFMK